MDTMSGLLGESARTRRLAFGSGHAHLAHFFDIGWGFVVLSYSLQLCGFWSAHADLAHFLTLTEFEV